MDIETLRNYCLDQCGVVEWKAFCDSLFVFKVLDRMFLCIDLEHPDCASMKCAPDYALELRDTFAGIEGAFHFNKKYWNQVYFQCDVPDKLYLSLVDHSYNEVLKKFTRKQRELYDKA